MQELLDQNKQLPPIGNLVDANSGPATFVLVIGVAEVLGFTAFTIGARDSVAVASVLASQFAAIGAIGAYLLFKERLGRLQIAGVIVLVLGVSTLTLLRSS